MMFRQSLSSLLQQERGATIIEFAIILPTFLLLLMGTFDMGYNMYAQGILNGAVQKAARDSSLETGLTDYDDLDEAVSARVQRVVKDADFDFERKSYYDFTDVGRPEEFDDDNANGVRDAGECFEDENDNSEWDADVGDEGLGGAKDVVRYQVTITYDRLLPIYGFLGWPEQKSLHSSTVLRNQPYAEQAEISVTVVCT